MKIRNSERANIRVNTTVKEVCTDIKIIEHFKDFINCTNTYAILKGGAASGKSYTIAQKILLRCLTEDSVTLNDPDFTHTFLVMRKTQSTHRDSTFSFFTKMIDLWKISDEYIDRITLNPLCIKFRNGNQILFKGINNEYEREKLKSIQGITGVWIEEANQITYDDFLQIVTRVRQQMKTYTQHILSFNPVSTNNWIYKTFYDQENKVEGFVKNAYFNHSTYLTNPFATDEIKEFYKHLEHTSPDYYKIYCLGEWGELGNHIFEEPILIDEDDLPESPKEVIYGMDFGYNVPSAIVKISLYDDIDVAQSILYQNNLTTSDLLLEMERLNISKRDTIYADSADPRIIEEIKRNGYNIKAADKSVKNGIYFIKSNHNRLRFLQCVSVRDGGKYPSNMSNKLGANSSVALINEMKNYMWKKLPNGEYLDEPIKVNDHAVDAFRYAYYTHHKGNAGGRTILINGKVFKL